MDLSAEQLRRYARHLILPEVGVEGQKKICAARILILGAGGLGSPVAIYLAAAGVGTLGLVDFDVVDLTNLHRQPLHGTSDVGRPKVASARETLNWLNPQVQVITHPERLTAANAREIVSAYDLVVDCTDNFPARYLANDACVLLRKPNVYGAIFRFEGQAGVFAPHLGGPCYRCLYPEPPPPEAAPNCAEAGVLGVLPGLVGCLQATEALKLILGGGDPLLGRLLVVDAWRMRFKEIKVRRDPHCPVCGDSPTITQLMEYQPVCGAAASQNKAADEITVQELKACLEHPRPGVVVLDVREPEEYQIARIPGTVLLPLSQLPQRVQELDPEATYYLHCKSGMRSMKALQFLRQQGFKNLKSVKGGIAAWSEQIDPKVPKY
ncbi:MAG: molybdopterin-synthase adenylyltransferase MoeB [Verrucomicrobiae bacterium]|nr:molybdopterin-synthase adenylyltransferase MoeB [Verrucomicrobiae bacterium]